MNKSEMRKFLAEGVALYLASGKQVTKGKPATSLRLKSKKEKKDESIVEIDVNALPEALRKKHFGDC